MLARSGKLLMQISRFLKSTLSRDGRSMTEKKVYRIVGRMLLSHDHFPEERLFRMEVVALSDKEALERVYSQLGSKHKLKRSHIKILEIEEVPPEQAASSYVKKLLSLGESVSG